MALSVPTILQPRGGVNFSTTKDQQIFSGAVDGASDKIFFAFNGVQEELPTTQVIEFTVAGTILAGETFTITINGTGHPVTGNADVSSTVAALVAAIQSGPEAAAVTATNNDPKVTVTADVAGQAFTYAESTDSAGGTIVSTAATVTPWSKSKVLAKGLNIIRVFSQDSTVPENSATVEQQVILVDADELSFSIQPPTGLRIETFSDRFEIFWASNTEAEAEVDGYNVYQASESGGAFSLVASVPQSEPFTLEERVLSTDTTVSKVGTTKTTTTVEEVQDVELFRAVLEGFEEKETLFFVVTAEGFEASLKEEAESQFSQELSATTVKIERGAVLLGTRTAPEVREEYANELLESEAEIDVKPGSLSSSIHIGPPSLEFERIYFLLDFVSRTQSFLTLLELDDADANRESDLVGTSDFKIRLRDVLGITNEETQDLIDSRFDALAGNVGVERGSSKKAIGEVVYFKNTAPTADLTVAVVTTVFKVADSDAGEAQVNFAVTRATVLKESAAASFFNVARGRYELVVPIEAENAGASGNVGAGQIKSASNLHGFDGVENLEATQFGADVEANVSLAERAILLPSSSDVGMKKGYLRTAVNEVGVRRVGVVDAGSEFMFRDFVPFLEKNIGGDVDVFVQVESAEVVEDTFALLFPVVENEIFTIQSASLFLLRTTNLEVSTTQAIYRVDQVTNVTKAANYDLTGLTIVDGIVINLDETNATNIAIGLDVTDVVQVTYAFRKPREITLDNKPVLDVLTVTGEDAGALVEGTGFQLRKIDDVSLKGNSTEENSFLEIKFDTGSGLPSGDLKDVEEQITLVGELEQALTNLGVDVLTIEVLNLAETTTYVLTTDYVVTEGTEKIPTTIKRSGTSTITDGQTVKVKYKGGETFTVRYQTNSLVSRVQDVIKEVRHATANVLVKSPVRVGVDLDMTVVLREGADKEVVDSEARTRISRLLNQAGLGVAIHQSDIVALLEDVNDVDFVVIPFLKMARSDDTLIVREKLPVFTLTQVLFENVGAFRTDAIAGLFGVLEFPTKVGGGDLDQPINLYFNDLPFKRVFSTQEVTEDVGRFFVEADGRIVLSPLTLTPVTPFKYEATYQVLNDERVDDVLTKPFEFLELNDLVITYVGG